MNCSQVKKQILSKKLFFTFLVLLTNLLLTAVLAENATRNERTDPSNFEYIVEDDNTVTITKYTGTSKDILIPHTLGGLSVTKIGDSAFSGKFLLSIDIPDTVHSIGNNAFKNNWLQTVAFPDSVQSIGDSAFADNLLETVSLPDSVTSLGAFAFSNCRELESVELSANLSSLSKGLFYQCYKLATIEIPNSVTTLDDWVFSDCKILETVIIPEGIISIGKAVFQNCDALTSVIIPNTVTSIGESAFSNCKALNSIKLPNNIKVIERNTFHSSGIENITLPESLETIETWAFGLCKSLNSIELSANLKSIGVEAFKDCKALTEIVIPDSVESISKGAFENCIVLASVTIGSGISQIEEFTFANCKSLIGITIPGNVETIGEKAFEYCDALEYLEIAEGVESIDGRAFQHCEILNDLQISDTVTSIGEYAFAHCLGLESLIIPDSVTELGKSAFSSCQNLETVEISNSLTTINEDVFAFCHKLDNIVIPDNVTTIGRSAFTRCFALSNLELPANLKNINESAFSYCESLTEITLPDSLLNIGKEAFMHCKNLQAVILSDNLIMLGASAFAHCTSLDHIIFGSKLKQIENYAFYFCESLTTLKFPESLISLGSYAFNNCSALNKVYFLGNAPSVGNNVFTGSNAIIYHIVNKTGWGNTFAGLNTEIWQSKANFHSEGGQMHENSRFYNVAVPYAELPIPAWTGYEFQGWWTERIGGEEIAENSIVPTIITDHNLYARWELGLYTITFDSAGGDQIDAITANYNSEITAPETPIKEGYTFIGWDPMLPETMPAEDITCVAQWTINQYTITFDSGEGTTVEPITQDYNSAIIAPEVPFQKGHTFVRWAPKLPERMPAEDITCVAQWTINQYTITFDSAGGTLVNAITQDYNSEITAPEAPIKEGYTFIGWEPMLPETMPAEDITCVAQWEINQYTINFDSADGTTVEPITQDYNSAIITPEVPFQEGHTFVGWEPKLPETMPAEDITCVAQWTINQYTITFDSAGGTLVNAITQDYNSEITAPEAPIKEGYTFIGWEPKLPGIMPAEDMLCVAQWEINQYTITFDSADGTLVDPVTQDYNSEIIVPEVPFQEGHTFVGWEPKLPERMPAEDMTCVAIWGGPYSYKQKLSVGWNLIGIRLVPDEITQDKLSKKVAFSWQADYKTFVATEDFYAT